AAIDSRGTIQRMRHPLMTRSATRAKFPFWKKVTAMTDAASSRSHSAALARKNQGQGPEATEPRTPADKRREAHRVAEELYRHRPDWVLFFREVLGVGGVVPRLFPSQEELAAFKQTPEYAEIQKMLADLRYQGPYGAD